MLQCMYITKPCHVPVLLWPFLGGQLVGLRCDLSSSFCNTVFFHTTPQLTEHLEEAIPFVLMYPCNTGYKDETTDIREHMLERETLNVPLRWS